MKKFLIILVSLMILLPISVFADTTLGHYTLNRNVIVGGYREIRITTSDTEGNHILKEIILDYDPNYFMINKSNISIYTCGYDITNHNDIKITLSSGKVSIKATKDIVYENCVLDPNYTINLDFLAIKSGKSNILLSGYYFFTNGGGTTTISSDIVESSQECPKCEEKECPAVEEKECPKCEEKECPVCEENECPKCVTEKNSTNGKSILIMVCSFLIGAALATMIFLIIKNKSKKE